MQSQILSVEHCFTVTFYIEFPVSEVKSTVIAQVNMQALPTG